MTSNSELRDIIKNITFMKMSEKLAKGMSYDPKHQVGALIVKNDWTKIDAMGYNGAFKGSPNKRFSLESGQSKFIHAEMNAIAFSTLGQSKAKKYTIFVTLTPCEICSRLIVNKGIKNVVALNRYEHCGDSLEVFQNANVKFSYMDDMIRKFFIESKMVNKPKNIISSHIIPFETNLINNINKLENELVECLKSQIGEFFEFDKSYLDKLPKTIFNEKYVFKNDKENVLDVYIDVFVKTLYELV